LDCPEGYITPQILTKVLRKKTQGAVIMEFPTFGGAVQPLESLRECSEIAKSKGIHVHIDGARVFSGLAELKITPQ
jgi:threonine aldolase